MNVHINNAIKENESISIAAEDSDRDVPIAVTKNALENIRQLCASYRVSLSRNARVDLHAELATIRANLRGAALAMGPEEGRLVASGLEAIMYSPSDPYAGILQAESVQDFLAERAGRIQRLSSLNSRCRLPLYGFFSGIILLLCIFIIYINPPHSQRSLRIDSLAPTNPSNFHTVGINTVTESADGRVWLWAYGPKTELWFQSDREALCFLVISLFNLCPNQVLSVAVNSGAAESFDIPLTGFEKTNGILRLPFLTRVGQNIIVLGYCNWNHQGVTFAPDDARPISVAYAKLRIEPAH